ncbi:MAG: GNAT family N-acetyltransferase [Armatimonadetes bacterium]|nr:GNAT family N-acetyltransferase [Armatimonadota bacterium]
MPVQVTIRLANSSDYHIYDELYSADDKADFFTMEERLERRRQQFAEIDENRQVVLVAEADGKVVGAVQLAIDSFVPGAGMVRSLAVRPSHRRQGIGSRLMDAVEDLARQRGLKALVLLVRPDNEAALAMYRKRGYTVVSREERTDEAAMYELMRLVLVRPSR